MIKSMTVFASLNGNEGAAIGVTIRSVNHRFSICMRLPPAIADVEPAARPRAEAAGARRVRSHVSLQLRQASAPQIELNQEFAHALAAAMEQARERGLIAGALTRRPVAPASGVSIREKLARRARSGAARHAVDDAVASAIGQLEEMRVREGLHLRSDLDARKGLLSGLIARNRRRRQHRARGTEARLLERAREIAVRCRSNQPRCRRRWCASRSVPTHEEVTRFHGTSPTGCAVRQREPCGPSGFPAQEMNAGQYDRSKAAACSVGSDHPGKAELERMREQVQNVE